MNSTTTVLLYGVRAHAKGVLPDLYFVSANEQEAIQVAARLSCVDYATCAIEEYIVPQEEGGGIRPQRTYHYYHRENIILNDAQAAMRNNLLESRPFQLSHFYLNGVYGITETGNSSRRAFAYQVFLEDRDLVPDFGQGAGELFEVWMNEYEELTGDTDVDPYDVRDALEEVYSSLGTAADAAHHDAVPEQVDAEPDQEQGDADPEDEETDEAHAEPDFLACEQ